jgi:hypothetical protein
VAATHCASLARIARTQAAGFDQAGLERLFCRPDRTAGVAEAMIRNGLYHITVEMLDGVQGGNQGVMVVRDGTLRGGDSFFYAFGTYTAADGKWKGEVTNQEHSPTFGERPVWERKVVTIGFTGTYTDDAAESDGIALAGKQSIRFKSRLRLLVPD